MGDNTTIHSTLSKPLLLQNLLPYCLFKFPALSLIYEQVSYIYLSFFKTKKSNPQNQETAIEPKTHEPWTTLKCLPQVLIGCCFVPDDKNKDNAKGRSGEGNPDWNPTRKATTIAGGVGQLGRTAEGLQMAGVITH